MRQIIPMGDRIFVDELEPEVSVVKRAQAAGLYAVVKEENVPKPTTGIVVAIGDDPLIQSRCKLGDIVSFAVHAGVYQQVEGKQYRCIEGREIISLIRELPDPVQVPDPIELQVPDPIELPTLPEKVTPPATPSPVEQPSPQPEVGLECSSSPTEKDG